MFADADADTDVRYITSCRPVYMPRTEEVSGIKI